MGSDKKLMARRLRGAADCGLAVELQWIGIDDNSLIQFTDQEINLDFEFYKSQLFSFQFAL